MISVAKSRPNQRELKLPERTHYDFEKNQGGMGSAKPPPSVASLPSSRITQRPPLRKDWWPKSVEMPTGAASSFSASTAVNVLQRQQQRKEPFVYGALLVVPPEPPYQERPLPFSSSCCCCCCCCGCFPVSRCGQFAYGVDAAVAPFSCVSVLAPEVLV